MAVRIRQEQLQEYAHKARQYCAYQERSRFDVESKLYGWGLGTKQVMALCKQLEDEGFLNQERFVTAYVKGKFNRLGWGKVKIANSLRTKNVDQELVETALKELESLGYEDKIRELLQRKQATLTRLAPSEQRRRMYAFALQRGFETELVGRLLTSLNEV